MWPDKRLLDLFDLRFPIIQAPMAGSDSAAMAASVSAAGGLGSLGCALRSADEIDAAVRAIRNNTNRPFNLNFFCHAEPREDAGRDRRWIERLRPYYEELGIEPPTELVGGRQPFNATLCDLVEEIKPPVVSFHFGLPEPRLVERVREAGCKIMCSATTPEEAVQLAGHGVDAVIAQGYEAGGHRGTFAEDWRDGSGQIGTMALVPQIADAVDLPVIAAGGIADGRGIAAALALGAAGAQLGTAYLFCPESAISPLYRSALCEGRGDLSRLTNVFTGRPARGLTNRMMQDTGPISPEAPDFPLASPAVMPLRQAAEKAGSSDFTSLWAGQAVALGREIPAADLTRQLAEEALDRLRSLISGR